MKTCWDTLDGIFYKNGKFYKKSPNRKSRTEVIYHEECLNCKIEFFGRDGSKFCSNSCSNSKEFHNFWGKKREIETKEKIRKALLGNTLSDEHKNNISKGLIGIEFTQERRDNIRKAGLGRFGEKHSAYKAGKYCWYDTYAHKIGWAESIRRSLDDENILEVRCTYCGKWYKPTNTTISNRIKSFDDNGRRLYCSDECKGACPIYWRKKYPKGFTGDQNGPREVQPELRKLVLERDNYTCQKCNLSSNDSCIELHCHHIDPVKLNPIESADVDNCITLCKDCHNEVHQKDGCKTGQLANC